MKKFTLPFALLALLLSACYQDSNNLSGLDYYGGENVAAGDKYTELEENPFVDVSEHPVSTFSIDADGASYANVRRFIVRDQIVPPKGAIRTEELINYFDFDYPFQESAHPISLHGEVSACPWKPENKLIRIGIEGQPVSKSELPLSNYVFLIDVSGSMSDDDKLELLKKGFNLFVDEMRAEDRVAIVTYAGSAGVALSSTPGTDREKIKNAIHALGSGGSTAGAQGIITAYEIAQQNFITDGNNRIIMGTDGDFNVGVSSQEELVSLIEEKRDLGIFLTVLGVGRGNLNDASLEQIANNGNGTYEYIDKVEQLKKVFIYEASKFYTVAKDVKVQVVFNPSVVSAYRLIGYENRLLATEDFEDDKKDAGEIGANQNITALYEIVPAASSLFRTAPTFTIDFRYKLPDADTSIPLELEVFDEGKAFSESTAHMKFASGVASFSLLLMDSPYKGSSSYESILDWIDQASLPDPYGFKSEFRDLVVKVRSF